MYHITPPVVQELQEMSRDYFTAVVLFTDKVSGTVWSIEIGRASCRERV